MDSSFTECTLIHITNKITAEKSTRYLLLPGFFTLYSFRLILGTFWLLGEALLRTPDVFFFMYVRLRLVSPRWILVYLVRIVNRSRIFQELPSTTVHFSQDVIGMLFRHLSIWRYQHTTINSCPQHLLLDGKKKNVPFVFNLKKYKMLLRFGYYGCYSFHKANLTTAISAPLGLRKRESKKTEKWWSYGQQNTSGRSAPSLNCFLLIIPFIIFAHLLLSLLPSNSKLRSGVT